MGSVFYYYFALSGAADFVPSVPSTGPDPDPTEGRAFDDGFDDGFA